MLRFRLLIALVVSGLLAAGCSSGHHSAKTSATSTSTSISAGQSTSTTGKGTPTTLVRIPFGGTSIPTIPAPAAYACGLTGGGASAAGKVLIRVDQINGLLPQKPKAESVATSVATVSGGVLRCTYTLNDKATLVLAIDTNNASAPADFNQTLATKISLNERGCSGCRIGSFSEPDHIGTHEYTGRTLSAFNVVGVIDGSVYFEFSSNSAEIPRFQLELMGQAITG